MLRVLGLQRYALEPKLGWGIHWEEGVAEALEALVWALVAPEPLHQHRLFFSEAEVDALLTAQSCPSEMGQEEAWALPLSLLVFPVVLPLPPLGSLLVLTAFQGHFYPE